MRAFTPCAVDKDSLPVSDPLANLVFDVGRLCRHRPNLRDRDEAGGLGRPDPQQQIGERQIREELPFADKQVEPVKVRIGQRRVGAGRGRPGQAQRDGPVRPVAVLSQFG